MNAFEHNLEKYAALVLKIGVNLRPGQILFMESPLEARDLTRLIVKKAYGSGAKHVEVFWNDEEIMRARYVHAEEDTFSYYPEWKAKIMEQLAEEDGALLNIKVPDPGLFQGIDSNRINTAAYAASRARQKFQEYVRGHAFSWSLIKAPTAAWSAKVFPELTGQAGMDAMWDAIFQINRVYADDPVEAWREHLRILKNTQEILNRKRYRKLIYTGPGTELSIELPEGHLWIGGGDKNRSGVSFVPNMPTEEVFTMPKRDGVNGTVASTMPLNLNGRLVDRFSLTFRDGKVVDFTAEKGKEHLASLLETDAGARFLGEVALVPHDSPISNLNRIFYNTGIDENASCHLALGNAYPINLENGTKLSKVELAARGANVSMAHTDFMIGSSQLDIDGLLPDGSREAVFRNGNWAIELDKSY